MNGGYDAPLHGSAKGGDLETYCEQLRLLREQGGSREQGRQAARALLEMNADMFKGRKALMDAAVEAFHLYYRALNGYLHSKEGAPSWIRGVLLQGCSAAAAPAPEAPDLGRMRRILSATPVYAWMWDMSEPRTLYLHRAARPHLYVPGGPSAPHRGAPAVKVPGLLPPGRLTKTVLAQLRQRHPGYYKRRVWNNYIRVRFRVRRRALLIRSLRLLANPPAPPPSAAPQAGFPLDELRRANDTGQLRFARYPDQVFRFKLPKAAPATADGRQAWVDEILAQAGLLAQPLAPSDLLRRSAATGADLREYAGLLLDRLRTKGADGRALVFGRRALCCADGGGHDRKRRGWCSAPEKSLVQHFGRASDPARWYGGRRPQTGAAAAAATIPRCSSASRRCSGTRGEGTPRSSAGGWSTC